MREENIRFFNQELGTASCMSAANGKAMSEKCVKNLKKSHPEDNLQHSIPSKWSFPNFPGDVKEVKIFLIITSNVV